MNKKQMTMLAVGVIAIVAIYWFFFRKKDDKKESSFNPDYLVIGDEMGYSKSKGGLKPKTGNSTQDSRSFTMVVPESIGNTGGNPTAKCNPAPQAPGCFNCANAAIYYGWCPGKGVTGWGWQK